MFTNKCFQLELENISPVLIKLSKNVKQLRNQKIPKGAETASIDKLEELIEVCTLLSTFYELIFFC